jgi:hypothetical protein
VFWRSWLIVRELGLHSNTAWPWLSQERRPGVFLEQVDPTHMAAQREHAHWWKTCGRLMLMRMPWTTNWPLATITQHVADF